MLLYSTDLDLEPERIFRFYGARFQNRVCLPRRQAASGPQPRPGPLEGPAALSFQHRLPRLSSGPRLQARLQAQRSLGPFSLRDLKRHNLEEEIYKRIAAGSATGRNAPNSHGRRPPHPAGTPLAARTASRNGAGRPLNAAPRTGTATPARASKCVQTIDTADDITGYMSGVTIAGHFLDRINDASIWVTLRQDPERYIHDAMQHGACDFNRFPLVLKPQTGLAPEWEKGCAS